MQALKKKKKQSSPIPPAKRLSRFEKNGVVLGVVMYFPLVALVDLRGIVLHLCQAESGETDRFVLAKPRCVGALRDGASENGCGFGHCMKRMV